MFKTGTGGLNSFLRGWSAFFIIDVYDFPQGFCAVLVFIIIESILLSARKRIKNFNADRTLAFVIEAIVCVIMIGFVSWQEYRGFAKDYGFGKWFYVWTMAGKKELLPGYIVNTIWVAGVLLGLTYYVHFRMARRSNFLESRQWISSVALLIFFLIMNYEFVNGLKTVFRRPYEVNIRWGDWLNQIDKLSSSRYEYYMNHTTMNWSLNPDRVSNFNQDRTFPWWRVEKWDSSMVHGKMNWGNITDPTKDAFPSGHINCIFFMSAVTFVVFKNPENKSERIAARSTIVFTTLYNINMILCLEMTWSHWMSDMAFTLVVIAIIYPIWRLLISYICNSCEDSFERHKPVKTA